MAGHPVGSEQSRASRANGEVSRANGDSGGALVARLTAPARGRRLLIVGRGRVSMRGEGPPPTTWPSKNAGRGDAPTRPCTTTFDDERAESEGGEGGRADRSLESATDELAAARCGMPLPGPRSDSEMAAARGDAGPVSAASEGCRWRGRWAPRTRTGPRPSPGKKLNLQVSLTQSPRGPVSQWRPGIAAADRRAARRRDPHDASVDDLPGKPCWVPGCLSGPAARSRRSRLSEAIAGSTQQAPPPPPSPIFVWSTSIKKFFFATVLPVTE